MGPGPADLNADSTNKDCDPSGAPLIGQRTMGPGSGLVAHVLWRYCMRLASSGVGGVWRVRLAFGRHPMPDAPPHTHLPTYNNASRTRRTPPTPDDASRMQYRHEVRLTPPQDMCHKPWPWPYSNLIIHIYLSIRISLSICVYVFIYPCT